MSQPIFQRLGRNWSDYRGEITTAGAVGTIASVFLLVANETSLKANFNGHPDAQAVFNYVVSVLALASFGAGAIKLTDRGPSRERHDGPRNISFTL